MYRLHSVLMDRTILMRSHSRSTPIYAYQRCWHTTNQHANKTSADVLSSSSAPTLASASASAPTASSSSVSSLPSSPIPPTPLRSSTIRRRRSVSDQLTFQAARKPNINITKKATVNLDSIALEDLHYHEWRKLPESSKWSHLGKGVFRLVPPNDGREGEGEGEANETVPSLELHRGLRTNLFRRSGTIHRIIGFESDLIEESRRDSTATAEVVLVGRSNVGKSSLLNAILKNGGHRKQLATTSKTPGRTQVLFMFSFKDSRDHRIVDCPGYGYAKATRKKSEAWNRLMGLYIRKRAGQGILKRVLVLIDVRRGIGPLDEQFMQFLEIEGVPYQVVLTKVDALTPARFKTQLADIRAHLQSMPQGRFGDQAARDAYEAQENRDEVNEDEDQDEDNSQWQEDVDSGQYSQSSLPSSGDMPSYSCSIPIIHAVSSRLGLGITSLQHSLTKMLTMEKNLKCKAYSDVVLDGPIDDGTHTTDGMSAGSSLPEPDDVDEFVPPIPVSHYDDPRPRKSKDSTKPKPPSTSKSSRTKFGYSSSSSSSSLSSSSYNPNTSASGRRGFATSAKSKSASSPRKRAASADSATTVKDKTTKANASKKAISTSKSSRESDKADSKSSRPKRARSTPPATKSSQSHTRATSNTTPTPAGSSSSTSESLTPPTPAASSSPASPADAHLATIYQKKSQRQHILDRSETYIGSMHHQHSAQWVLAEETETDDSSSVSVTTGRIVQKECYFVPSLVHIFDEILVNAADNQHRTSEDKTQVMTTIKVDIDASSGRISIFNDGASIPIAIHPTENIPIPELIFGHLLTSSNYNDKEQRFTGGRHGYGAKLTNIFSTEFTVEIQDVARAMRYRQTFRNNMADRDPPEMHTFAQLEKNKVSKKSLAANYTRISFIPDYQRFHEPGLTVDTIGIMKKRVYDIAACVNTNIMSEKTTAKRSSAAALSSTSTPSRIKVYLNGRHVESESFTKYLTLFPTSAITSADHGEDDGPSEGKWVFNTVNSNWQIGVGPNVATTAPLPSSNPPPTVTDANVTSLPPATRDISFVNSIYTSRGGTHVNHVAERVTRAIIEHILKTQKTITREMIPPGLVKAHMSLLVNCKIPNPSFSSQTKESLMTPVKDFGSECVLDDAFIKQITSNSTGIVPAIVDSVTSKQQIDLLRKSRANAKNRGKLLRIPKLDDANWAGSSDPAKVQQTTLILTEGDSAKALVLSSLSILGRDKYGVFPLKGKLLNVRDASLKQVMENSEIQNILAIVGLEIPPSAALGRGAKPPPQQKPLRYGRIMLMTDQDHDGSHIKGLFINLLHTYWPHLLHGNNFLEEFVTAIIKVRHLKTKQVQSFFTQREFETWKNSLPSELLLNPAKFKQHYAVKYYKGLGTNTSEEGKEYFRNIQQHRVKFLWGLGLDQKTSSSSSSSIKSTSSSTSLLPASAHDSDGWIRLAFAKDSIAARKEWLQTRYHPGLFVDTSSKTLPIYEFINKELIIFSHADNIRSIPTMFDGLKPVQRKILFGCFKRGLKSEIKVAQLSGYISEHTAYHHGEVSLQGSIINMAQSFVGSHNIPLLVGSGQFGSRHTGGKDAAAARYIYTSVANITRAIFHPADDPLLTYNDEDGVSVEPTFYLPVIPTVLVNGSEGIGTGFSSFVPGFNPQDLIDNLRRHLNGDRMQPIHPWIRGWRGKMIPVTPEDSTSSNRPKVTNYVTEGIWHQVNDTTIEIRELPFGRWPEEFKNQLSLLQADGSIKRFFDQSTDERIQFRVEVTQEQAEEILDAGPTKFFKLTSHLSLNNMHLFDGHLVMRKYTSALEILREFAVVRLEYYRRRREHLIIALEIHLNRLQNKSRFISEVTSGKLTLYNKKKKSLIEELHRAKYATEIDLLPRFPIYADHTQAKPIKFTNDVAISASTPLSDHSYDYLLDLPLSTLTAERLHSLQTELANNEKQLSALQQSDEKALWLKDLDKLEAEWNKLNKRLQAGQITVDEEVEEAEVAA